MRIYNAGDTGYQPEKISASLATSIDVMIAPINGEYGNLDSHEAVELAAALKPRLLIASHFRMFVEHGGDPAAFLAEAKHLPPASPRGLWRPAKH